MKKQLNSAWIQLFFHCNRKLPVSYYNEMLRRMRTMYRGRLLWQPYIGAAKKRPEEDVKA